MNKQYLIEWEIPKNYNPSKVLARLPSPISSDIREIYNYSIKPKGFYFLDRRLDAEVAGNAFKIFVDEALLHCKRVSIIDISVAPQPKQKRDCLLTPAL